MAHPDGLLTRHVLEQPVRLGDRHGRRAVLAVGRRQHLAAELVGHQLDAVADAQDGDAGAPQPRIDARRVRVVDAGRPTREDDAAGVAAQDLGQRRVVRQELGVDLHLAHAPGDELGRLAAEVQDHDRVGLATRRGRRLIGCLALGGRSAERRLEVGLHLRVVGRQHTVAGVGRFAMDRLAATSGRLHLRQSALRSRPPAPRPVYPPGASPSRRISGLAARTCPRRRRPGRRPSRPAASRGWCAPRARPSTGAGRRPGSPCRR